MLTSIPYPAIALISILIFALVHLFAEKARRFDFISQGIFLSIGGGVAIAYVFVDLLPKLCSSDLLIKQSFDNIFPYLERHVFIMALMGFLLFFIVDKSPSVAQKQGSFWLSLSSYVLFNFLVGYSVTDKDDPEVRPLALFTIAIALHYFTIDYSLNEKYGVIYNKIEKWLLIFSLVAGWLVGVWITLPEAAIALISAFLGGGIIMNVIRHELPKGNPHSLEAFVLSAMLYTAILLTIG